MTDEEFRAELRSYISSNLPPEMARRTLLNYHPHRPDVEFWTAKLHERSWSAPHWPVEYGGPGWSISQQHIFEEESFLAGCPAVNPQAFTLVGPIIYTFGNEEQKARFLPPILSGKQFWAQGFSEPNSGSDLASLQTRAIRDGDSYVVNGQKIWTSEAHYCDWIFMLVRTSTEGKPQAGISFLLIDLKTPGITIRPIIGIDGGHILNEVFFEDVKVPIENLIGEENKGWTYSKALLGAERTFTAEVPRCKGLLARIRRMAQNPTDHGRPLIEDKHFARRLAQLEIEVLAHEATLWRIVAEEEGAIESNSPAPSVLKVKGAELVQRLGLLSLEVLGDDVQREYLEDEYKLAEPGEDLPDAMAPGLVADVFYRRSMTIYGGSNEIQRNIISGQLLRV